MASFSLRHPYFIVVICLFVAVLGLTGLVQMPVDMFPPINIPVVLVATFYGGMPPAFSANEKLRSTGGFCFLF